MDLLPDAIVFVAISSLIETQPANCHRFYSTYLSAEKRLHNEHKKKKNG